MKRIALLIAALAIVPALGHAAGQDNRQPTPVAVQNTSANPVPVTGSVAILGAPTFSVADPAVNAVQFSCTAECAENNRYCYCRLPEVPSGKRWVIETIGVKFQVGLEEKYEAIFSTYMKNFGSANYPIVATTAETNTEYGFVRKEALLSHRLYADHLAGSGSGPAFTLVRIWSESPEPTSIFMSASGYFIDLP